MRLCKNLPGGGGSATENKGVQEFTGTLQREMRLHKNLLWDLQWEMGSCKNLLGLYSGE